MQAASSTLILDSAAESDPLVSVLHNVLSLEDSDFGADWLFLDLQASHTAADLCALPEPPWREGTLVLQSSQGMLTPPLPACTPSTAQPAHSGSLLRI